MSVPQPPERSPRGPSGGLPWLAICLGVGIFLRLAYYLKGGSLWLDEIALSQEILGRNLAELLFRPLEFGLAAPAGFLLAQKLITSVFGGSEYALRALPLLASLGSLLFFTQIASRFFRQAFGKTSGPMAAVCATAIFAVSPLMIRYAAEAKPYALDIFFSVFLTHYFLKGLGPLASQTRSPQLSRKPAFFWKFCLLGALAFFFSYSSALVTTALLVTAVARSFRDRSYLYPILTLVPALACISLLHWQGISVETHAYLNEFWMRGFYPLPRSLSEFLWPWFKLKDAYFLTHHYPASGLYAALSFLGVLAVLRERSALLIIAPVAMALLASALRLHPFENRHIAFLTPQFTLLLGGVTAWGGHFAIRLFRFLKKRRLVRRITATLALFLAMPIVFKTTQLTATSHRQEMKRVLEFVQKHTQPGDGLYVYYGAWQALQYYGPALGFNAPDYFQGKCHRETPVEYLKEINEAVAKNERLWLILTMDFNAEHSTLLSYLSSIATPISAVEFQGSAPFFNASAFAFKIHEATNFDGALEHYLQGHPQAAQGVGMPRSSGCIGLHVPR